MASGLCRYKDALGKPDEGIHSWRIRVGSVSLAGADLLLTAAAAALLSKSVCKNALVGFAVVFIILMIVAIALHRAFCVDTALNRYLGLDRKSTPAAPGRGEK